MVDAIWLDTYAGDRLGDVHALMDAGPPWHGFTHKLTQGTYHEETERVLQYRTSIVTHPRYAVDFWENYYCFLDLNQDSVAQCDYFWEMMMKIGGEKAGTIWAMVDVERGGQRSIPSAQQVFDGVTKWADRYKELSGKLATLYGGELLRSLGIHRPGAPINLLGCGRNAIALYGPELAEQVVVATGTDEAHLEWWQYCGTDPQSVALKGYPLTAPGFGRIDLSVLTVSGGLDGFRLQLKT